MFDIIAATVEASVAAAVLIKTELNKHFILSYIERQTYKGEYYNDLYNFTHAVLVTGRNKLSCF